MTKSTHTRADLIAAAMTMVGAPYAAQGRGTPAVPGYDCGGVLIGLGRDTGITVFEFLGYSANPDGETFERLLDEKLDRIDDFHDAKLADVLACDFGEGIQHTMLIVGIHPTRRDWHQFTVIHATRKHGVNRATPPLQYYKAIKRAYSMQRYVID